MPTETWACEYVTGIKKIESKAIYLRNFTTASWPESEPRRSFIATHALCLGLSGKT
jgi:hypothetical protein